MLKLLKALMIVVMVALVGAEIYDMVTPKEFAYVQHTVSAGETLMDIALQYGSRSTEMDVRKIVYDICETNKISAKEVGRLQPGRVLLIPLQK